MKVIIKLWDLKSINAEQTHKLMVCLKELGCKVSFSTNSPGGSVGRFSDFEIPDHTINARTINKND